VTMDDGVIVAPAVGISKIGDVGQHSSLIHVFRARQSVGLAFDGVRTEQGDLVVCFLPLAEAHRLAELLLGQSEGAG
jgi:hypothetical protein